MSPQRLHNCIELAAKRGYCGPIGTAELIGEMRVRYIGTLRFQSPCTETFDEFLIGFLKYTLGKLWGRQQVKLPRDRQHIVIQWLFDMCEEKRQILGDHHDPRVTMSARPTGYVMELLSLADDLTVFGSWTNCQRKC